MSFRAPTRNPLPTITKKTLSRTLTHPLLPLKQHKLINNFILLISFSLLFTPRITSPLTINTLPFKDEILTYSLIPLGVFVPR